MTLHVKQGGTWKTMTPRFKHNGAWQEPSKVYVKQSGVWKEAYSSMPAIGDLVYGGYMAGVIDTTLGNIPTWDVSQTGAKYMVIVAPQNLRSDSYRWQETWTNIAGAKTMWDGLTASNNVLAAATNASAINYINGLSYPSDGGSKWYMPAVWELELAMRNLKPISSTAYVGLYGSSGTYGWPYTTVVSPAPSTGYNPASSPQGGAYTSTNTAQSPLALFQTGGAQALDNGTSTTAWASTQASGDRAWMVYLKGGNYGRFNMTTKASTGLRTIPVRRIPIN
jgi:hypothetical protein